MGVKILILRQLGQQKDNDQSTGWPKKNNTETNQNYTYTYDIFGIYTITICKDIK